MNLCSLGWHKYKFFYYYPEDLQPQSYWRVWIEKCTECGKEKSCNDLIK